MPRFVIHIFLLILLFSACGGEGYIPPLPPDPLTRVCVGQTTDMDLTSYDPPLEMVLQWDSAGHIAEGEFLLDLDGDSHSETRLMAYDLSDSVMGNPYGYPALWLRTTAPNLKVGETSVYFPIGLGQSGEQRYATQYPAGECLSARGTFHEEPESNYLLWFTCPGTFCPPPSIWETPTTEEVYLGFLWEDRQAGWIRLDMSDPQLPRVLSHAILNPT